MVHAAAVADEVADVGEQVRGVAHHPPPRPTAGAHGSDHKTMVDIDVTGHDVVVADRDRIRAFGQELLRASGTHNEEPQHLLGKRNRAPEPVPRPLTLGLPAAGSGVGE